MNEKDIQENSVSSDVPVSDKMSYCNGRFVKMAVFAAKTETPFMVIGLLLGFLLFLVPTIHVSARQILHEWPFLYAIFDAGVRLKAAFVYPLLLLALYNIFVYYMAISKGFADGWDKNHERRLPTAKEVMGQSLFPNSKSQSVIFSHWFFLNILSIFWWFSFFALLGNLIRIGGVK